MNLVLGIFWLLLGIGLFTYTTITGHQLVFRGLGIPWAWPMFVLAAYNFVRWYGSRAGKEEEKALRIVHEARLRKARTRERPSEIDPTFDFTSKPPLPPLPRGPTELPPSNN